jgi:hypothetical protein
VNDVLEEEKEEVWRTLLLPGHAVSSVSLQEKHVCHALFRALHRKMVCEQGCFSDADEKRQVLSAREGYAFLPGLPLSI